MPDGTVMGGDDRMSETSSTPSASTSSSSTSPADEADGPSSAAAMICSRETAGAVQDTFSLADPPHRTAKWSDGVYRCDYKLPAGVLKLTVADLDQTGPGRAWFDHLRSRLSGTTSLTGMENFGFPAFETTTGDVVFLKDHKTLWVDATALRGSKLPAGYDRTDVAYQVAVAVVACWDE